MIKTAMVYILLDKCLDLLEQNLDKTFIIPKIMLVPGRYKSLTIDTGTTMHILYNVEVDEVGCSHPGVDDNCVRFTLYGKHISKFSVNGEEIINHTGVSVGKDGIKYIVPVKNIKSFEK